MRLNLRAKCKTPWTAARAGDGDKRDERRTPVKSEVEVMPAAEERETGGEEPGGRN